MLNKITKTKFLKKKNFKKYQTCINKRYNKLAYLLKNMKLLNKYNLIIVKRFDKKIVIEKLENIIQEIENDTTDQFNRSISKNFLDNNDIGT